MELRTDDNMEHEWIADNGKIQEELVVGDNAGDVDLILDGNNL